MSSAARAGWAVPHDYVCFQAQLEPLIMNIHGESEHVGKRPRAAAGGSEKRTQLIRLRREMKEAIDEEHYERASALRDEIRNESRARGSDAVQIDDLTKRAASGCGAPAPRPISSSAAASAWRATWPTFLSSAAPRPRTAPASRRSSTSAFSAIAAETDLLYVNVSQLEKVDRQFLVERHLISREHADGQGTAPWPSTAPKSSA